GSARRGGDGLALERVGSRDAGSFQDQYRVRIRGHDGGYRDDRNAVLNAADHRVGGGETEGVRLVTHQLHDAPGTAALLDLELDSGVAIPPLLDTEEERGVVTAEEPIK